MNRDLAVGILAALALHGTALFAFRVSRPEAAPPCGDGRFGLRAWPASRWRAA